MASIRDFIGRIDNYARATVYNWLFQNSTPPSKDEIEQGVQDMVVLARHYYDGNHVVYLTDRQEAWLKLHGKSVRFTVNHCPVVVDAVVERLKVTGFKHGNAVNDLIWEWWQANRMDAVQTEAHRYAVRDAEAFILTNWDDTLGRPVFTLHPRFTDTDRGGDGYGMWIEYPNNDYLAQPIKACKQWRETVDDGHGKRTLSYRTDYYPDRVEKFVFDHGRWDIASDVAPWLDPQGQPLGIPVAHLRNPGIKSELRDVIPLQDALNKDWLDILGAADATGFRMLAFFGWIPTTDGQEPKADGSNLLQVAPGQMFGTPKAPNEAAVQSIEAASAQPLLDIEDRIVIRIASVSSTPLSRFISSRQVAAEGTLQQEEGPLLSKVEERQTLFGNAWEDTMKMALKLSSMFGGQALPDGEIDTVWAPAAVRNEAAEIQIAEGKKRLGVPTDEILQEIGYTPQQIANMQTSPEWEARIANMNMATLTARSIKDDKRA